MKIPANQVKVYLSSRKTVFDKEGNFMIESYILEQLAAFSKFGTLSRVSEELYVSQPAISRSMQKLENELDVKIFDRSKNKIQLNANGKIAAEYAKKIVEMQKEMIKAVRDYNLQHRSFKFGTIAPAPIFELKPIISQLYVGAEISADLLDSEKKLQIGLDEGTYKIIFLTKPLNDEKYYNQKIFSEHLFSLMPKNHRLAKEKSIELKDLAGENILILSNLGFWYDIVKNNIPDVHLLNQSDTESLSKISNNSSLLSFITNLSNDSGRFISTSKTAVPIRDSQVNVTFYAICLKRYKEELKPLFSELEEFRTQAEK